MGNLPWAFLFILSTFFPKAANAADGAAASGIPGAVTFPPGATATNPSGTKPSITVPTPDTIPPPNMGNGAAPGAGTSTTIPAPSALFKSRGKYRNEREEVKIDKLIHDRYKQSVVRVTAKDLAGNVLARAMGVGIGRNSQFIATPLSIILGNSQQWADRIEITHFAGNKYEASVALIDEEKNLVLLSPEASPAPIVFAAESNERPQIDVFTISFENAPDGTLTSSVHRGRIAAANSETGLLSVSPYSGEAIDDAQAGTGIIDSEGRLIGMLLPGGRGVLSSTLQKSIQKAKKTKPIDPKMIGVILGRGVLVDPSQEGAFKTVGDALAAIKKGTAPSTDPNRYIPARNRAVSPKESDKIVIKVMPGTYKETKPIILRSNMSFSGSGPGQTTLQASANDKPVVLVQGASNVMISGFRFLPAPNQSMKAPALIVSNSSAVTMLGNLFESKEGVAAWVHESQKVSFFGNAFARGNERGLSCDKTDLVLETNAFLGNWSIALALEKGCHSVIKRNLFLDNKISVNISPSAGSALTQANTFVRANSAIRLTGVVPKFSLYDSLFYEGNYGLQGSSEVNTKNLGRNAAWRSRFVSGSRPLTMLDIVRTEPIFEAPASYDFRVKPGKGHAGSALQTQGADLGAFQRTDFLGQHSGPLARAIEAASGQEDLAGSWGLVE